MSKKENKLSLFERSCCLAAAIVFTILHINVVPIPPKQPTKEVIDKKIEDFKKMIARGGSDRD